MQPSDNVLPELSWIDRYLEKLTIRFVLIFLIVISSLIAWNRGIPFLYALTALLVSTLFFSWLLPDIKIFFTFLFFNKCLHILK